MLIFHTTDYDSMINILKSDKLLTGKQTGIISQSPLDKPLPFVYFSTCPEIIDIMRKPIEVVLYFDSDLLKKKNFYTDTNHAAGIRKTTMKYPKDYDNIDLVLKNLYDQSIITNSNDIKDKEAREKYFYVFQEVFIRGSVGIKNHLKYIKIYDNKNYVKNVVSPDELKGHDKLRNILLEKYPNVKILIDKLRS